MTVTTLRDNGRFTGADLPDGSRVEADVAVVALWAVRNADRLSDSGLTAGLRGVVCDAGCRAFDMYGIVTDVFVAGDAGRFPHLSSSIRWSTGATRSRRPRWRPATWSAAVRAGTHT
ncbi:hypothetical protein [Streptomyces sp. NPDC057557]|uniref:hypothetical protein n=1 Tax=Streptomyces sp. NPDC057557 TaxID=3346167 RepID=UPI003679C38B